MRRLTYWMLSTLSVVVLLFGFDASSHATSTVATPPAAIGSTSSGETSTSGSSGTGSTSGSSGSTGSGSTSTGSGSTKKKSTATTKRLTGDVASTEWGPVQVQLTVKGGKISAVSVLQYPNGNGKDAEINNYALPILVQETTDQQSADIDMVSGATVTSNGYIQSLQSALDQA